jgi:arylsulfatase A-like enzyme
MIDEINREIRNFRNQTQSETLVVANYMEAHAPFNPPEDAVRRFADGVPIEDLPIGKSGRKTREQYLSDPEYDASDMYKLYLASIWDLDRRVTPLVSQLLDEDTVVIISADHGNWFRIDSSLEESRIHVPLLIFTPETDGEYVEHTVNLRHIAATTTALLEADSPKVDRLPGENLLEIDGDLTSFTEFIDRRKIGDLEGHPVQPRGADDASDGYFYYISGIKGDSKINYLGGDDEYEIIRGSGQELEELRTALEQHTDREVNLGSASRIEFDTETEDRLRKLGYLD